MKTLTHEQKQEYKQCGGIRCPLCGSENIQTIGRECDGAEEYVRISCKSCHAEWSDTLMIVNVELLSAGSLDEGDLFK